MNHVFERLIRIGVAVRARLLLAVAILLLTAAPISAQSGFTITSPTEGSLIPAGQPITVTWTGDSSRVNVQLIDVEQNQVVLSSGGMPNSGSLVVTIGVSGGTCGRLFRFYVEDDPRTTWTYGPVFTVVCPTTVNVADGDVSGLIAAINAANANLGPDIINLAPGGTYTLTAVAEDDGYWGPTGTPYIRTEIAINGNGATIQRSSDAATPAFRILFVFVGNLTLDRVTLMGGYLDPEGGDTRGGGGGLGMTGSTALIRNSTITGNYASAGGGVLNWNGTLRIENSTISYNTAYGGRTGGGIMNFSHYGVSTTTISSSTIFENQADGPTGFEGRGDAISAYYPPPGSITFKNSILASPTRGLGSTCIYLTPTSGGYNIADDASCGLTGSGDLNSTDPLLGSLSYNGSPTPTHVPLPGSPAIDAVPIASCTDANGAPTTTDQRGIGRPQGAVCDIGSVEVILDNTATGTDVSITHVVTLPNGETTSVALAFDTVTSAGNTSVAASSMGPPPPSGFKLGNPPVYYDITTTAIFTGNVRVCLGWSEGQIANESRVSMFHYENGRWLDITDASSRDPVNNTVCGVATSLSPFALMEVTYAFTGFFQPVDNMPTVNAAKAGAAVPVKFSLGGDWGLNIFAAGYPRVQLVQCSTGDLIDSIEETVTAGSSTLSFDAASGRYTYIWKTDSAWANSCRELQVQLNDGEVYRAWFTMGK
jgi:hypothetical protein